MVLLKADWWLCIKFPCFLCLWISSDSDKHYIKGDCSARKSMKSSQDIVFNKFLLEKHLKLFFLFFMSNLVWCQNFRSKEIFLREKSMRPSSDIVINKVLLEKHLKLFFFFFMSHLAWYKNFRSKEIYPARKSMKPSSDIVINKLLLEKHLKLFFLFFMSNLAWCQNFDKDD